MARRRHALNVDDLIPGAEGRAAGARRCDRDGCEAEGAFRAPKSPNALSDFHWFCLDHVREYNARWNYFADKSDEEVEALRRGDTYWHRPTWPLNGRNRFHRTADPHGMFDEEIAAERAERAAWGRRSHAPAMSAAEVDALAVLGLEAPVDRDEVKRRYKELVKRHHPDANGGDKAAEERLKTINQAYNTLMRGAEARQGAPAA